MSLHSATAYLWRTISPPGTIVTGVIEMTTDRCDVESILADMNVFAYQITDCDNPVQIMHSMKKIPEFYYEKM